MNWLIRYPRAIFLFGVIVQNLVFYSTVPTSAQSAFTKHASPTNAEFLFDFGYFLARFPQHLVLWLVKGVLGIAIFNRISIRRAGTR